MGWLYSRNVPALTEMMLREFTSLRQDEGMMRGYMFLMDFLEAVAKETSDLLKKNQRSLKLILEAAKVSEAALDKQIAALNEEVLASSFLFLHAIKALHFIYPINLYDVLYSFGFRTFLCT